MVFGIGLHVLIALFFAVHAIKSGRPLYWLLILFSFPLFGSIVYFFAEYLPSSRLQHSLRSVGTQAVRSLDPGRDLREARQAFDLTPTAQNQLYLAEALLAAGNSAEAVTEFEHCLLGPFARDTQIRLAAARAMLVNSEPQKSLALLLAIRDEDGHYQKEMLGLLLAQSYAASGNHANAKREFEDAVAHYGSIEARVEYGVWAATNGDIALAKNIQDQLNKDWQHWPKHARQLNKELLKKLNAALDGSSA